MNTIVIGFPAQRDMRQGHIEIKRQAIRCACNREVILTGNTNRCQCGRRYNLKGEEV